MPSEPKRILILGGTGEGRALARRLTADPRYSPVTSLAGLTSEPEAIDGETRTGGFGGAAGLASFIDERGIAAVVDAAHPFAARISANAVDACRGAGVPCLRLERARWEAQGGDEWTHVGDVEEAAAAVPPKARAFVTVGRKEIAAFMARDDVSILARMIERPDEPVPRHVEIMLARPPFTTAQETNLMRARGITVLVTKNSGGDATYAKVAAARELEIPVIMVLRPKKPPSLTVATVDDMVAMLSDIVS